MISIIQKAVVAYASLAYLVFGLSLLGIVRPALIAAACVVSITGLAVALLRKPASPSPLIPGEKTWLLAVAAVTFIPMLHVLLVPPFMRDDMIYHLVVPKMIAITGAFPVDPLNINTNFPMLFELPLTATQFGGVPASPHLANLLVSLSLALSVYAMVRERGVSLSSSLICIPVIAITPVIYDLTHSSYVDLFFTVLVVLALYQYQRVLDYHGDKRAWYWAAALLGLACATKYFGLVFLAGVCCVEFFRARDRRRFYAGIALATALCLPWYVKNWIALGNPVYPLVNTLFGSPHVSAERLFRFVHLPQSYNAGRGAADYLLLPLRLLTGVEIPQTPGSLGFGGALSAFFALSLIGIDFRKTRIVATAALLVYAVLWAAGSQQVRFLLPVLIPAAVNGLARMGEWLPGRRGAIVAGLFLLTSLGQGVWISGRQMHRQKIDALLDGSLSRDCFLAHHMPATYPLARWVNEHLDRRTTKIFTMGVYGREYYFDVPVITNTYFDTEAAERHFAAGRADPAGMDAYLKNLGVTHLLIVESYLQSLYGRDARIDLGALRDYLARRCRELRREGATVLLAID